MTHRLYYTDAYLQTFEAQVVDATDGGRRVYLDQSAFYPTSGGQPNDLGTLDGVAVTDVVDEGERVAHVLAAPWDAPTSRPVQGALDWARRYDQMQQHTGQHLLSAVFADSFGWDTLSVHFGPDYATLDLATESMGAQQLQRAERIANAAVTDNQPVSVTFEHAAEARGLRKAVEREGTLRIVSIDALDRSACGGTHVRATGEIGPILLRRQEKVRKATRVEFLCGMRAVRRARTDYEVLTRLAQGLSCSIDELAQLVPAQALQLRAMENEHRRLAEELARFKARERYADIAPDGAGIRRCLERRDSGRADDSRALALAFCALPQAAYLVLVANPPAVLAAASDDSGLDVGRTLKASLAEVGGKGGGSARLAQGTVPAEGAPESLLKVAKALGFSEILT
ncbi:MAG: DHHA1 domain-containing protein [Gemmatimonadaceae bacterium]